VAQGIGPEIGGVAQGIGPRFKSQHHTQKNSFFHQNVFNVLYCRNYAEVLQGSLGRRDSKNTVKKVTK
jgi:hypothetical protein